MYPIFALSATPLPRREPCSYANLTYVEMHETLHHNQRTLDALNKENRDISGAVAEQAAVIADLSAENQRLDDLLTARGKTIGEQGVSIADLLHQVSTLSDIIREHSTEIREHCTEIDSLREKNGALHADLNEAARAMVSIRNEYDTQGRRMQHLKDDKEFLKEERNGLRREIDRLNSLLDAKRHELFDVYAERNKLRQEVEELRAAAAPEPLADWERELLMGADIGWTVVELSNRPRYQVHRHVYYVTLTTDGEITPETVATAKSMAEMTAGQHYVDKVNKGYDGPIHYTSSLPTYNTLPERGVTFIVTLTLK